MSGVFVNLLIVRSAEENPKLKYAAQSDAKIHNATVKADYHTAVTLRAAEPFFGTNRTIVADSHFSSVSTAYWCFAAGLNFMGIVKTAHKYYPKDEMISRFKNIPPEEVKGHFFAATCDVKLSAQLNLTVKVNAVSWTSSSKPSRIKHTVSTRGTTVPGSYHKKGILKELQYEGTTVWARSHKDIPRPKIVQELFDNFSTVDVHDHYRQGSLNVEDSYKTKNYRKKIWLSLIAMHITDAYRAYKYENFGKSTGVLEFITFASQIAHGLIHLGDTQGSYRLNPHDAAIYQVVRSLFSLFCH